MNDISLPLAFAAGLLSFLSPCVLPLVPSYVSFITGLSFESLTSAGDEQRAKIKRRTIANSVSFILGFSSVFIGLGASSSAIGQWLFHFQDQIRIAGGIIIIIFGLFISGILKLDFLMRERKFHLSGRPAGYIGAFLIGMTFAAGWTPCIGPILGGILLVAATKGSALYGLKLLSVYSLGLALPFLASALAMNTFLSYSKRIMKYMKIVMLVSGLIMVFFGIMLLENKVRGLAGLMGGFGLDAGKFLK
ncbi:MAG: sulfite exporter TauE/SafE family protein [Nitrospiraceae bacterium]|nr:sulfite exporter TauE/SafE family protein [Nitrospiraceae bacterium]